MKYIFLLITIVLFPYKVTANELLVNVINAHKQAVKNMVVYIRPIDDSKPLPINYSPLIIDQKGEKFSPYITVMQKGQAINFVNKDDITHHIYSVSGENRFEFKIKAGESISTEPMLVNEEIAMGCNIHDWMSGYALVVNTPYYGKTNKDGELSFSLSNLGEYAITAWHPQLDVVDYKVTQIVTIDEAKKVYTIELPNNLLPIPKQEGQDEFDFIEEY